MARVAVPLGVAGIKTRLSSRARRPYRKCRDRKQTEKADPEFVIAIPHPCCHHSSSPLEILLRLKRKALKLND
jgi:2-methylcitrate dehydratase PrpD